jgi:hypothetical protein
VAAPVEMIDEQSPRILRETIQTEGNELMKFEIDIRE